MEWKILKEYCIRRDTPFSQYGGKRIIKNIFEMQDAEWIIYQCCHEVAILEVETYEKVSLGKLLQQQSYCKEEISWKVEQLLTYILIRMIIQLEVEVLIH